ncbi:glycoside hydrolase [Aspergillus venezuelensis]
MVKYLIKQYLQTSGQEPIYREMWDEALAGIQKYLVTSTKRSKLQFITELPQGIGVPLSPKMDHLFCFLPGSIALGATEGLAGEEARALLTRTPEKEQQMQLARELTKTCWAISSSASQPPGTSSNDRTTCKNDITIKPLDGHNLQRPETVESLFLMHRITNDPIYREWGWEILRAFKRHILVPGGEGYTSLQDVTKVPPPKRDNMESFWLAETLKYLYLLFSPRDFLPLSEVVFSTEAHILPQFNQTKFRTGWERMERL